jgi:hypothetical protein
MTGDRDDLLQEVGFIVGNAAINAGLCRAG